jgi:hypothetical protein
MFLRLYDEVTNVLCVSLFLHDRYQYDSLILSKQTWAYPRQHLRQLLWCQGRWRDADVTKECLETNFHLSSTLLSKLCVHFANGFNNVESLYFFYSNPVYPMFPALHISMPCACAIFLAVVCPVLPNISPLSHKKHNFEKKKYWTWNMFWSSLQICPKHFPF